MTINFETARSKREILEGISAWSPKDLLRLPVMFYYKNPSAIVAFRRNTSKLITARMLEFTDDDKARRLVKSKETIVREILENVEGSQAKQSMMFGDEVWIDLDREIRVSTLDFFSVIPYGVRTCPVLMCSFNDKWEKSYPLLYMIKAPPVNLAYLAAMNYVAHKLIVDKQSTPSQASRVFVTYYVARLMGITLDSAELNRPPVTNDVWGGCISRNRPLFVDKTLGSGKIIKVKRLLDLAKTAPPSPVNRMGLTPDHSKPVVDVPLLPKPRDEDDDDLDTEFVTLSEIINEGADAFLALFEEDTDPVMIALDIKDEVVNKIHSIIAKPYTYGAYYEINILPSTSISPGEILNLLGTDNYQLKLLNN